MQKRKLEHNNARLAAIQAGEKTYVGKPCRHGHDGTRFIGENGNDRCVGCYKAASKNYYQRYKKQIKQRYKENREKLMFQRAKARAKQAGLPFNIELEDIVIPEKCPVFGTKMKNPSLDRKVNDLGYVKGNVFVISNRANSLKGNMTIAELEKILHYMRS